MRALVLTGDRRLKLVERDRPRLTSPRDVLVRVHQTGICGTDRSVLVGKFSAAPGVVMGHEAVGEVAETGPEVTGLAVGRRVIVNPTLYCGRCAMCLRDQTNFCHHKTDNELGIDRDGSYADYIVLEDRFLHTIPDGVGYDRAVLTEPLACVLNNLDAARIVPGDPVTVIGGGPIGLVFAVTARHLGSPVRLIERDAYRHHRAGELLARVMPGGIEVVGTDAVHKLPKTPTVVDTVGNQLDLALGLAAVSGTVVVMGYDSRAEIVVRPLGLLQRGLRIVGAGDYHGSHFPRAVELAARLPLEELITHRFPMEHHEAAFAMLAAGGDAGYSALKVVIHSGWGEGA